MNQDKPDLSDPEKNEPVEDPSESSEVDDFLQKLPSSFRWPKPDDASVAAAVEAIHRISSGSSAAGLTKHDPSEDESETTCSSCGGLLPEMARFCVWCGAQTKHAADNASLEKQIGAEQHHIHHHYHHLVPSNRTQSSTGAAEPVGSAPRGRAHRSSGASSGGRSETAARKVVQDWTQACNTKHIDDLLDLYSPDATLIRSSVPPVRSLPAIRTFLVSLLEAGLGDVEMESLRLEVLGDIALDLGRCKMLVPVAMGKRREERGKYLIVLVRQPAGTWKILADCWSADQGVNVEVPAPAVRNPTESIRPSPPPSKPR